MSILKRRESIIFQMRDELVKIEAYGEDIIRRLVMDFFE